ncbi:MAG: shikimate dehydrogenase [Gemmatimonadota bacterium]
MVTGKTKVLALLGSPVEHSVSPSMQNAAFRALGLNAIYVPLCCSADALPGLLNAFTAAGGGGNITLPHKAAAAGAVSDPSSRVRETGACNTFWRTESGGIGGENTDIAGILAALDRLEAEPSCWLLLGTGGSARAVVGAARERSAAVAVQSRSDERQREFETWGRTLGVRFCRKDECEVVINATPLGLKSDDALPIVPENLPESVSAALDLVYAKEETRWVHAMRKKGIRAHDGREAVIAQGARAFECWFPHENAPIEVMRAVVNARLR